jgi:hypothetical protein
MDSPIRTEISQLVAQLPEDRLKPVLEYLRQVEYTKVEELETMNLVKKIFEEDDNLLRRLAQ